MAYSLQREVSDGSLQYVNITIQYFDKKDLFVYKDGLVVPKTSDEPSAEWSYVWDGDRIKINKVVPIGAEIVVRRKTPYAEPMHIYRQGAVFKDSTMDDNFLQMLLINQENAEGLTATDFYNDLDFHGYRLKNVGAAKVGTDAMPYSQYIADASGAYQNRIAAEQARDTTQGFKAEAQTAMATAKEWANKLGATVDATEYSAKYYSIKAKEYSVNAKNSKDAAAVSETNALRSKNDTALLKTQTQQIVDKAQDTVDQIAEINALVNDVKGARLPVGVIVPFPARGNYPGYLYLDGSAFDKAIYKQLAVLYPSGVLPDLRSSTLTGVDDGKGKFTDKTANKFLESTNLSHTHTGSATQGGAHDHTGSATAAGAHSHSVNDPGHKHGVGIRITANAYAAYISGTNANEPVNMVNINAAKTGISINGVDDHTHAVSIAEGGAHTHDVTVAASGGTESRPYSYTVYWYIKAVDSVGQPEVIQAQDLVNRTSVLEGKVTAVEGKVTAIETNNLNRITELDGTTNLNDVIVAGFYAQSIDAEAKAELNYPTQSGGTLLVQATPDTHIQSQIYIAWSTNLVYTRTRYGYRDSPTGPWTAWAVCYTSANMRFEF